jgi:hypothetical protein
MDGPGDSGDLAFAARLQLDDLRQQLQCRLDAKAALAAFLSGDGSDAASGVSADSDSDATASDEDAGARPASEGSGLSWDEELGISPLREQIAALEAAVAAHEGAAAAAALVDAEAASELLAARLAAHAQWESRVQVRGGMLQGPFHVHSVLGSPCLYGTRASPRANPLTSPRFATLPCRCRTMRRWRASWPRRTTTARAHGWRLPWT